jgi:hypothetical protein
LIAKIASKTAKTLKKAISFSPLDKVYFILSNDYRGKKT